MASQGRMPTTPGRIVPRGFFQDVVIRLTLIERVIEHHLGLGVDEMLGGQPGVEAGEVRQQAVLEALEAVELLFLHRAEQPKGLGRLLQAARPLALVDRDHLHFRSLCVKWVCVQALSHLI